MDKRFTSMGSEDLMKLLNKKHGSDTVIKGSEDLIEIPRLPFGVFIATYGSGGGAPVWCCTRLRGAEGSGKTTMALSTMRQAELLCWRCYNLAEFCTCSLPPIRMKSLYVDVEGALDPEWVGSLEISRDQFYIIRTAQGDQALEAAESMLKADDIGLVIIDSIAHLLPSAESDRLMGDRKVASLAQLITHAVAKLQARLTEEKHREHPCLVLATNQLRFTISSGYGNPETESGGQAFRHWFSLGARMSKLSTDESKYKDLKSPVKLFQRHGLKWDKERFSTLLGSGEFLRAREDIYDPRDTKTLLYKKASVIDDDVIITYLKQLDMLRNGFSVDGLYDCKLLKELKTELRKNDETYFQLHIEMVRRARSDVSYRMPSLRDADVVGEEGSELFVE